MHRKLALHTAGEWHFISTTEALLSPPHAAFGQQHSASPSGLCFVCQWQAIRRAARVERGSAQVGAAARSAGRAPPGVSQLFPARTGRPSAAVPVRRRRAPGVAPPPSVVAARRRTANGRRSRAVGRRAVFACAVSSEPSPCTMCDR